MDFILLVVIIFVCGLFAIKNGAWYFILAGIFDRIMKEEIDIKFNLKAAYVLTAFTFLWFFAESVNSFHSRLFING